MGACCRTNEAKGDMIVVIDPDFNKSSSTHNSPDKNVKPEPNIKSSSENKDTQPIKKTKPILDHLAKKKHQDN